VDLLVCEFITAGPIIMMIKLCAGGGGKGQVL